MAGPGRQGLDLDMTVLLQALRTLRRSPGFLLLATASMSIGVGAAGALLAVIDAAFMRPLRYPSGERLVAIQPVRLENGKTFGLLPWPYFEAVRGATGLELVSYLTPAELEPVFDNVSSSWTGARVSPHAVTLLGIRPVLGRVLQATDFDAGGPDAVIISTELWKSRFGGDPGVLGRTLPCDARVVRIVGV